MNKPMFETRLSPAIKSLLNYVDTWEMENYGILSNENKNKIKFLSFDYQYLSL